MDRRDFLGSLLAQAIPRTRRLGLYVTLRDEPEAALARAQKLGFSEVEIYNDRFDRAFGSRLADAVARYRVQPVALFSMGPGAMVWDFVRGPGTIGLVPRAGRRQRIDHLIDASEFAKTMSIPMVETHCGFIPEDPADALYRETVDAIREVAGHCRRNSQIFLYHAGQESAATLLRTIEDVGLENQGVGLDTANPIMYGKGNPVDSVEMLGRHLRLVNFKDGMFPKDGRRLGTETPIGSGRVRFRELMLALKSAGYSGPLLIERENAGERFEQDILASKRYLEKLAADTGLL